MNTNQFFRKNYVLKKGKNINVFWKGNKTKGGNKAEIDISLKITLQPEFFL